MAFLPECQKESNPTPQFPALNPVKVTTCQQTSPQSQYLKSLTNFCDTSRSPDGTRQTANWLPHQQGIPLESRTLQETSCTSPEIVSFYCLQSPRGEQLPGLLTNSLCPNILKTVVLLNEQAAVLCQKPCFAATLALNQQTATKIWITVLRGQVGRTEKGWLIIFIGSIVPDFTYYFYIY